MEHTDNMTDLSFTRQFSINPEYPISHTTLNAYDINE